jgi:hypothetical protein
VSVCQACLLLVSSGVNRNPWQSSALLAQLPAYYRTVRYVGARFPGSLAVAGCPGVADGANCQLFAYEVLKHFALDPPMVRSRELWADTHMTARVLTARPLDLVLFNATNEAWGAHVGVWIGDGHVLHLSAEVGRPAVWPLSEFAERARYRSLIGIKRVLRRAAAQQ